MRRILLVLLSSCFANSIANNVNEYVKSLNYCIDNNMFYHAYNIFIKMKNDGIKVDMATKIDLQNKTKKLLINVTIASKNDTALANAFSKFLFGVSIAITPLTLWTIFENLRQPVNPNVVHHHTPEFFGTIIFATIQGALYIESKLFSYLENNPHYILLKQAIGINYLIQNLETNGI